MRKRSCKILVVDDDKDLVYLIRRVLENEGFETEVVPNGAEAVTRAVHDPPCLMLLDYRLPDMTGRQVIEALAERNVSTPFIIMTGQGDEKTAVEMMKLGARDYLTKDIAFLDFLPSVVDQATARIEVETKLAKAEESLAESEKKYRNLVDNALIGIYKFNLKGDVLYANEALAKMLEFESPEEMGRGALSGYKKPEDGRTLIEEIKKAGRIKNVEIELITAKGKAVHALVSAVLEGDVISGMIMDITDRKRMEESHLRFKNLESIGTLAGGIAHDFNNILMVIFGNIELARMHVYPEDKIYDNLTRAESAVLKAKALARQLLTFSKGGVPVRKTMSIGGIIKDSADSILSGSGVVCDLGFPDDLRLVDIDEVQMRQVFDNIIINALEAMPDGGLVRVRAENAVVTAKDDLPLREGEYIKISVHDQGGGIPEGYIQRIFDPYFTLKEMGGQKGVGLGLSIAYSIVGNHDGLITVESEAGFGTSFFIYLPVSERDARRPDDIRRHDAIQEGAPKMGTRKGKVLVMDDDDRVRMVAVNTLQRIGCDVESARDGAEAIAIYKTAKASGQAFDAVILDLIVKGGMGGKETMDSLLAIDPGVKAVICSGYADDPVVMEFKKYGFSGFIIKPYRIEELRRTLDALLK